MHIAYDIASLKKLLQPLALNKKQVGFVPTMGALHQGHLSLIERAKKENDIVVCDIFVNPTQFNNPEDYSSYPVTLEQDIAQLTKAQNDILFLPSEKEMYPNGYVVETIDLGVLGKVMEGKYRPGHFDGVVTIVRKLFDIVRPHRAYFGEKDYQQLLVVKRLVSLFNLNIEILACPTIREPDGLAMSSRNMRLSPEGRKKAAYLYKALLEAKDHFDKGQYTSQFLPEIKQKYLPYIQWEYLEIRDQHTLEEIPKKDTSHTARIFAAGYVENVRLIDNLILV